MNDIFVHDRHTGETTRVSVSSAGVQGVGNSQFPSISADGAFVAFQSEGGNLVKGDTNGTWDIFVHELATGQTTRVSLTTAGGQGNALSFRPSISGDGNAVAFFSQATNLVPDDTNGFQDVFVHDRTTGETTRISVSSTGEQGIGGNSHISCISTNGRFIAFPSVATNLVPDDTNGTEDVFVHDRQTSETTRVSVSSEGAQGSGVASIPSISADGRITSFHSDAGNLVPTDANGIRDVFIRDRGPSCAPADTNCDGAVDVDDLIAVILGWGACAECADCPADIDHDCDVDVDDLVAVILNWG